MVKDGDEVVFKDAFSWRELEATVDTQGKKSLTVLVHAGFATADDAREVPVRVQIDQLLSSPTSIKVSQDGESNLTFYPGVPLSLEYSTSAKLENIPPDYSPVGFLRFRERSSNDTVLRVPVEIGG
jgi:hypothetical protein